MKRVTAAAHGTTHIEGPGVIVNIITGLTANDGKIVTAIEILADGNRYAGPPQWWIDNNGTLEHAAYVRVVQTEKPPETPPP